MADSQTDRTDDESASPVEEDQSPDQASPAGLSEQFYRGEMERTTVWRQRLDQTTNWTVVVLAAVLTWAFSSADNPHYVLLVGSFAVGVFLFIEAQRYREYDAWRERVRVIQENVYAEQLSSSGPEFEGWTEWLNRDLREPGFELALWMAVCHRLQHIYLPLLTVLIGAWGLRVTVFEGNETWRQTASVGILPGEAVVAGVAVTYLALAALTLAGLRVGGRREFAHQGDPDT